ncbi:MAG: GNAT family N-acetyltransferase [Woeseiaceae bacterium]|nr:GNAT family N-acetyltransferase [Woeseiaceae bacterium]
MRWRVTVQESDAAAVYALVTETGFFSKSEQQIAIELVEETLSMGKESGYEFVFVDMPGKPGSLLGYTCYGPIPDTVSSFDLYWIAVSPRQQRTGLGSALLIETERLALQQKASRMFVDTSGREQYTPTRNFYERSGYQQEARLIDFYAPGDDKVIYAKTL